MINSKIDLKLDYFSPWHFRWLGAVMCFAGMVTIVTSPFVAPIAILIGILLFSTRLGIQFDRPNKTYKCYHSVLLMKIGKTESYEQVTKLYVNSTKTSQTIYSRANLGTTFKNIEYKAYLKLDEDMKIYLCYDKNKEKLFEKLEPLSDFFGLKITDRT